MERTEYDSFNKPIQITYYGADEKPVSLKGKGFAGIKYKYDERGNQNEEEYIDKDGQLIQNNDGYAIVRLEYDNRGNKIRAEFFDKEGNHIQNNEGCNGYWFRYQEPNDILRQISYDKNGKVIGGMSAVSPMFKWMIKGNNIIFMDLNNNVISDRKMIESFRSATEVYSKSYELEIIREKQPELFLGARGILVKSIVPGSQAEKLGIKAGDVILELKDQKMMHLHDFMDYFPKEGEQPAKIVVLRNQKHMEYEISPPKLGVQIELQ